MEAALQVGYPARAAVGIERENREVVSENAVGLSAEAERLPAALGAVLV